MRPCGIGILAALPEHKWTSALTGRRHHLPKSTGVLRTPLAFGLLTGIQSRRPEARVTGTERAAEPVRRACGLSVERALDFKKLPVLRISRPSCGLFLVRGTGRKMRRSCPQCRCDQKRRPNASGANRLPTAPKKAGSGSGDLRSPDMPAGMSHSASWTAQKGQSPWCGLLAYPRSIWWLSRQA